MGALETFGSFNQTVKLAEEEHSGCCLISTTRHIALSPKYIGRLRKGVYEVLNAELGQFSDRLCGVLLAYDHVKLQQASGAIIDDAPFIHFDVILDAVVFQPRIGTLLKCVVSNVAPNHIGCLVHNWFNVSLLRSNNPTRVEPGFVILVQVARTCYMNGMLAIEGKAPEDESGVILEPALVSVPVPLHPDSSFSTKKAKKQHKQHSKDRIEVVEQPGMETMPMMTESFGTQLELNNKDSPDGSFSTKKDKKRHKQRSKDRIEAVKQPDMETRPMATESFETQVELNHKDSPDCSFSTKKAKKQHKQRSKDKIEAIEQPDMETRPMATESFETQVEVNHKKKKKRNKSGLCSDVDSSLSHPDNSPAQVNETNSKGGKRARRRDARNIVTGAEASTEDSPKKFTDLKTKKKDKRKDCLVRTDQEMLRSEWGGDESRAMKEEGRRAKKRRNIESMNAPENSCKKECQLAEVPAQFQTVSPSKPKKMKIEHVGNSDELIGQSSVKKNKNKHK